MSRTQVSIAILSVVVAGATVERPRAAGFTVRLEQAGATQPGQLIVTGRVTEIHAPQLFSLRESEEGGRDVLVLVPRTVSSAIVGASVRVEGAMRRFEAGQLKQNRAWRDIDEKTRARFSGRQVLIASSMLAAREGDVPPEPATRETESPSPPLSIESPRPQPAAYSAPPRPLTIRASTLVAHLDGFAGQQVRVLNARVVGVLEPRAFLIEPSTEYLKALGTRDRIVVLVANGALRVPADLLVGSVVAVEGIARTPLGMKVTAEVPWPDRLDRDRVKRWEVRAVVLASSVQTAEGTELTTPETTGVNR